MFALARRRRRSVLGPALALSAAVAVAAGGAGASADSGAPATAPAATPAASAVSTTTPIKHVVVIIGENHTFDNVFGTYQPPPGQTDPEPAVGGHRDRLGRPRAGTRRSPAQKQRQTPRSIS